VDYWKLVGKGEGAKVITKWTMGSGRLRQFALARRLSYTNKTPSFQLGGSSETALVRYYRLRLKTEFAYMLGKVLHPAL